MLKLINVSKEFYLSNGARRSALNDVSLSLSCGEFAVLVGANGSGKTTLFDVIAGRCAVSGGAIFIGGADVTNSPAHQRASKVALISQARGVGLPRAMTVAEVMLLALERSGGRKFARKEGRQAEHILNALEPNLERILDTQLWHLSGGEYQLVALAVADILTEVGDGAHVLLLDEHTSQLAPAAQERVVSATVALAATRNLTVLLATHSPIVATSVGNRQLIMSEGRIADDLKDDTRIEDPSVLMKRLATIA